MKKMIFLGLVLLSAPAFGMQYLRDQFCNNADKELTHFDHVADAIRSGHVKQVLRLVDAKNTTQADLEAYIAIADEHFGLAPEAKVFAKGIGALKVILGAASVYKAWDHFNEKYGIWKNISGPKAILTKIQERLSQGDGTHGALHCLIIDIASIGGFISAQAGINAGLNAIKPKCDVTAHLLIQLYLKNLVKPKNQTSQPIQAA